MTQMPPDPFEHPAPLWNFAERGALLLDQLTTMDPRAAFYAVMRAGTLSREELACIALVALSNRMVPGWPQLAEAARQGSAP
jgi:hypothetical protein